jgi:drug/metabolite transporter (DMT)-like permease
MISWSLLLHGVVSLSDMIYLIPPLVLLLGWALLHESPPWPTLAAGILCLAGVYLARHD